MPLVVRLSLTASPSQFSVFKGKGDDPMGASSLAIINQALDEVRKRLGRQSDELESAITSALKDVAQRYRGKIPLPGRDHLVEELLLQELYPAEFVVFIDHWIKPGKARRLIRDVLSHHPNWDQANKFIDSLSPLQRQLVIIRYQQPPDASVT